MDNELLEVKVSTRGQKVSTHADSVQSNIKCRHMTQKVSTPKDNIQIIESVDTWCRKFRQTWTVAKIGLNQK